jgi:hypothetical protein
MADPKKTTGRGVVDSIAALRLLRYNTKGPGAERAKPIAKPSIEKLRDVVAKVVTKKKKRKVKKGCR